MSYRDFVQNLSKARRRSLYGCLILTLSVGALASVFTAAQIPTWYAGLLRPSFAPSNGLFSPIWTLLYIVMAVAAWRVWDKTGLKSAAMWAFALQLALSFGWSLVFFALHRIAAALLEALVLDLTVLATTLLFFRHDRLAGFLFLLYLGWSLFVSLVTAAVWQLNGRGLSI